MMSSLLIANRGEIACRVIRTARKMGIRTVAVYSDADANALHVRMADDAVHIGPSLARESYLVADRIIAAAQATGAEAIHPGYGFLSENADFAQAVLDTGLVWVGPQPASIRAMGLKDAAKTLMAEAGVPVTPGYLGDDQSAARLQQEADTIGYPVLIKAVAGGGGKGMRMVERADDFADALLSCQREAVASFGNDQVLIEKYIQRPRHIEVQVFGDHHGNIVHLFERDCSLQRRHQKVIEEAPAPGMDAATREQLCAAAVRAAKAVNYVGAGTIEFIADASAGLRADRIWFMEMNTRLQVEHPVTEEITGVDLVEWQLRVASGERLPLRQSELSINGWAMEARLYAEDPTTGFLPSIGRIEEACLDAFGQEQRIDTGVERGDVISPYYDPMIAKMIAHGDDREGAIARLETILSENFVWPVRTNGAFLSACLAHADFRSGNVDTGLIARDVDTLVAPREPGDAALDDAAQRLIERTVEAVPHDARWPILDITGFRLNAPPQRELLLQVDGVPTLAKASRPGEHTLPPTMIPIGEADLLLLDRGAVHHVSMRPRVGAAGSNAGDGAILSPMPGRIIAVEVAQGDSVTKGQKLLTLEAMKMEHSLTAPFDGVVEQLNATAGAQVQVEALLARVTPAA
jgi:3-methylcrotonyl-CoA carboxylase alpha subunit